MNYCSFCVFIYTVKMMKMMFPLYHHPNHSTLSQPYHRRLSVPEVTLEEWVASKCYHQCLMDPPSHQDIRHRSRHSAAVVAVVVMLDEHSLQYHSSSSSRCPQYPAHRQNNHHSPSQDHVHLPQLEFHMADLNQINLVLESKKRK